MSITREDMMNFFRYDSFLEELTEEDMKDIALHCVAFSDTLHVSVEKAIENLEAL